MDIVTYISLFFLLTVKICQGDVFTHTWAAHIEGGEEVAKTLAEKHGFTYTGKIFEDHYGLNHRHVAKRSLLPSSSHHSKLEQEPQVKWLEQQKIATRTKRNSEESLSFNDPKWPKLWYINRGHGRDMNVQAAWQQGYKGQGVVVTIVDDGLETLHPDLKNNYDADASFDVNSNDFDPTPRYDYTNMNRHGTRCAGVVAAEANNSECMMGVAFESSIGGIRMLDGDVTDLVEARSLGYKQDYIDIYTSSWGPDDDGKTVDGPGTLTKDVLSRGVRNGRGGKGTIFVWSSGNGGRSRDWCSCDGYCNSIYTLSVSSVSETGKIPWYSEGCPSVLASTYSSGTAAELRVITTDLRYGCTEQHTGTSASAPMAAGICALTLSANPSLTWRDLQHIVVLASRSEDLNTTDWVVNGAGRKVSHFFGFGLMDAGAMSTLASDWISVPEQHKCEIQSYQWPRNIPHNGKISMHFRSNGCHGTQHEINYLEHVQAVITLSSSKRGEIQIYLTSPQGTRSTLLAQRPRDISNKGFQSWEFMTTHSWGEDPHGTWTLEIMNGVSSATMHSWSLLLYGTSNDPISHFSGPVPKSTTSSLLNYTTKVNGTDFTPGITESNKHLLIGIVLFVQLSAVAVVVILRS